MMLVLASAGIEQSEAMKRFLWYVPWSDSILRIFWSGSTPVYTDTLPSIRDNHFSAIASDQPSLEVRFFLGHIGDPKTHT